MSDRSDLAINILDLPWLDPYWQRIQQARRTHHLPHALLISGHIGLGKTRFAEALACALLCINNREDGFACGQCAACHWYSAGSSPDFWHVQPEELGKPIKVDQIRALNHFLTLTGSISGKVVLCFQADSMNVNAANSLLKTLEEPPHGSTIILVANQPARLPITVRSRCQSMPIALPNSETALSFLHAQQIASDPAQNSLRLAQGAPLLALQIQQDGILEQRQQLIETWIAVLQRQKTPAIMADLAIKLMPSAMDWLLMQLGDVLRLHVSVLAQSFSPMDSQLCHLLLEKNTPQQLLQHYDSLQQIRLRLATQMRIDWQLEAWFTEVIG